MEVIIFLTTSLDGKITQGSDDTDWIEDSDIERMDGLMLECGVMIMGSNTYRAFGEYLPNEQARLIVLTSNQELLQEKVENVEFTDQPIKNVLDSLDSEGIGKVMISGGSEVNTSALNAELVTEIRLIVKPLVVNGGKTLFTNVEKMHEFELTDNTVLPNGSIELRFKKLVN